MNRGKVNVSNKLDQTKRQEDNLSYSKASMFDNR